LINEKKGYRDLESNLTEEEATYPKRGRTAYKKEPPHRRKKMLVQEREDVQRLGEGRKPKK